jgi:stearoyl-CoA desaturase (delta-9 desaturase)
MLYKYWVMILNFFKSLDHQSTNRFVRIYATVLSTIAIAFFFNPYFLLIALVIGWMAQGISIEAILHRKYAHNQYRYKNKFFEFLSYFILVSTGTGKPLSWSFGHRVHHKYTDDPYDPQSPHTWGFLRIFLSNFSTHVNGLDKKDYPDMSDFNSYSKRFFIFNNNYYLFYALYSLLWFLIDPVFALYIIGIPCFLSWLSLGIVNLFSHLEYKNPKDLPFPLLFWGGNYHRRHHDNPGKTKLGRFDLSYYFIKLVGIENKSQSVYNYKK